jgi:TonB-dependent starch-binding outer membrane protein SusC
MKNLYLKLRYGLLALLFIAKLSTAVGQQVVKGTVVDQGGQIMPGVNIMIKNTGTGTTTDANGAFSIEAKSDDVLTFSFIGYTPKEVAVGNQSNINVTLQEDVSLLNEVVVIGYGEVKKSDLTGSVASVKGETLNQSIATGIDQALIGRVAGITATQMSGQPGGSVSIRIRGTSTINGDAEPLYVKFLATTEMFTRWAWALSAGERRQRIVHCQRSTRMTLSL